MDGNRSQETRDEMIKDILRIVGIIYYLLLIIIGTAGNILALLVIRGWGNRLLLRREQRKYRSSNKSSFYFEEAKKCPKCKQSGMEVTKTTLYRPIRMSVMRRRNQASMGIFTALAVADTLVLWINPLRYIIRFVWSFEVRTWNTWICKFHTFATYSIQDVAVWVLCFLTLERYLIARFPHKVRLIWTRCYKFVAWTVAFLTLTSKNLVILVIVDVDPVKRDSCDIRGHNFRTMRSSFFYMDLVGRSIIPFGLLLFFNLNLMHILRKSKNLRSKYIDNISIDSQITPEKKGTLRRGIQKISRPIRKLLGFDERAKSTQQKLRQTRMDRSVSQTNKMLIPVSFFHLCTSMPLTIFSIIEDYYNWKHVYSGLKLNWVYWTGTYLMMLSSANHGLNCFIYFASSRNFRRQFRLILRAMYCGSTNDSTRTEPESLVSTTSLQPVKNIDAFQKRAQPNLTLDRT
ncbi:hypothetical protein Ciccas_013968 [Cichlidogyrus casuarinus]|uniref:G-protein coupled receptors family 1 profile domain-containing protein n=1 Tax=Cichlidogyrus casuarinus TaxID=1844966 RepID=A0ABD2PJ92_9PLAT